MNWYAAAVLEPDATVSVAYGTQEYPSFHSAPWESKLMGSVV